MKKIFCTIILFSGLFSYLNAQNKVVELKQLRQDYTLAVKDSAVIIDNGSKNISFKIKRNPAERHYEFVNPGADSNAFYELLLIDKTEVNDKYNNALPGVSAALQLITVAAGEPAGIRLSRQEEGGVASSDNYYNELGGQDVDSSDDSEGFGLAALLIAGAAGLIVGIALMLMTRKKAAPAVPLEDRPAEDEEDEAIPSDNSSLDKLNAQLKKYRDDNKKLKAQLKSLGRDLEAQVLEYKQHDAFLSAYFNNVFNEFVKPFNEAVERNDQQKAFQILFQMAAHFSSLTKHELRVKQSYDTHNISYVLKENAQAAKDIETIVSATPKDNIPKNLKTLIEMMEKAGLHTLGQSIFYGYRIQKDK